MKQPKVKTKKPVINGRPSEDIRQDLESQRDVIEDAIALIDMLEITLPVHFEDLPKRNGEHILILRDGEIISSYDDPSGNVAWVLADDLADYMKSKIN